MSKRQPKKPAAPRHLHLGISVTAQERDAYHAAAAAEQRKLSQWCRIVLNAAVAAKAPTK